MNDQSNQERTEFDALNERYRRAGHRVQTAIAAMPNHGAQSQKGLRTGIDMGKADAAGLASLLMNKGVFTLTEYMTAITLAAEEEAQRYEEELSAVMGKAVRTL